MKSFLVLALGLLGVVDIVALEGSNSDQASSSSSGSGAVDDGATVGDSAIAVYLPTKVLQNQLLNATGMEPDSLVAVTSSYSVLQDGSPGLADIATPNTNVFTSVLIVPAISNNSEAAITSILETKSSDDLSGRTQLMYNCKSAANLWNLLEDPNVLTLEGFQLFDTDANLDTYPDTKKYSTTSEMQLAGTSEMKLKIFAPNGCVVDNKENVVSFTRTTSLSSGIDLELKFTLDIL
ncbi:hypothetical protein PF010_g13438 [Phytophthora fragariae]|uniref:LTD domain-containing protein n=1 Tax=Phytophthora fragariae TaxID=53985 RepID=A0A6A3I488_9STRA|nr:hypothetical protein PF003_g1799 [Phytophthora fragariae]KAE8974953.1 hypothetical protein PF011_g24661 [Phytophthora fragariae]KAE9086278.1 hypothetical protein PF006_g26061 [Phytophthora fragariae]KAE9104308.1 hypothetical protein PF010_g13438 [Phytophthora fragariae]